MTDTPDPAVFQPPAIIDSPDDALFDFDTDDWIDPPVYVTHLPETTPESNIRVLAEQEYRNSTTASAWNRYLTLGRYAVDGFTFDKIMEEGQEDPLKMHCLIWFQYAYHLDHKIDIPPKLQAWGAQRSQRFLSTHSVSAFSLDTLTTTWKEFSRIQSLSNPWSEVTPKQRKLKKTNMASKQSYAIAVAQNLANRPKPVTIVEETSKASTQTEPRGQKRSANHDDNSAASDGKQSVLIQNLNVPVCDGTYRVILRWKTTMDVASISRKTQELKEAIYNLLNDIFDDNDGFLYKWQHSGTDQYNTISQMTPDEVRQYISPSIGILPTQSMIVIPIRFGFSSNTPSKWRNLASTKDKLGKYDVTVSFSNCTSTSGNLVVAGYILLKAPMTTHRLRYLQSLRQQLPPTTPQFDILLHKRTPSDQLIPHLAVQCGNKTVHLLSEALAKILTGDGAALYIPRFAFSQMTDVEAEELFRTHNAHVKSLRWLPLFPLLSNLDKPCKEYHADGSVLERTTRDWARSIKTLDGSALAQCDVVNGGTDQLSYLLFTPQNTEAATIALEEYRKLLYPFQQREAQFRERVGPPPFIHLSKSVIANLDFIKRLSLSHSSSCPDETSTPASESDNSSASTPDSGITESSTSQATRPLTPAESLRQRYRQRTHHSDNSDNSEDSGSTSASTATSPSKLSDGRMSTSSAKIRELDAVIQRQKKTNDKKDAQHSERISMIERQLHRIHDLDSKLDNVQTDFGQRLNIFENRMVDTVKGHIESSNHNMANMNNSLEKLMAVVNTLVSQNDTNTASLKHRTDTTVPPTLQATAGHPHSTDANSSGSYSNSSSSGSSMSADSTGMVQSPEHKRLKARKKKPVLKESIRRILDSALAQATPHSPPAAHINKTESLDSLDHAMQQFEILVNADTRPNAISNSYQKPDPESQYTAGPPTHDEQDTTATISPGREAAS